jgi:hypothetical protein
VFKRLRRNRHQLEKDAASSSAQTVTQKEAEPQKNSPCARGRTYGVQAQPSFSSHAMLLYQRVSDHESSSLSSVSDSNLYIKQTFGQPAWKYNSWSHSKLFSKPRPILDCPH